MTNANPSLDPSNNDTIIGAFRWILRKFLQGTDDLLPAKVIAFDRAANRVQVQPLIAIVSTANERISRAQIASLPVVQYGGGGMILSFNLVAGDLGWIKASDRDISLFKQSYEEAVPNTQRMHNFSDAVFIPDVMTGYTIKEEDAAHAVLQTKDGSVRIAIWPDKVKITAPNVGVGNQDGFAVAAGAVLDVQSTNRAFKVPRMTRAQRNAIPSPTGGMMVYVTDAPTGFSSYTDGVGWS